MGLSPIDLLGVTYQALRRNPLRSLLTTLGVFMGVAAVNATLQVSTISEAVIARELAKQEAPNLTVYGGWNPVTEEISFLTPEDRLFLHQRLSGIQSMSEVVGVDSGQSTVQEKQATTFQMAVSSEYARATGRKILAGRFFTPQDQAKVRLIAIIDEFLVKQLFEGKSRQAIGQTIDFGNRSYRIVGVLETKEAARSRGELLITNSLYQALGGNEQESAIIIRPRNPARLEILEKQVPKMLTQRHPGTEYWAYNNARKILERQKILKFVSMALLGLGLIALVVGGIGIANITVASVLDRTPEIGLLRAIGATRSDIMLQFILEAVVLSVVGGTVAIASVHGITLTVAQVFELPYEFEWRTGLGSLGAAIAVGVGASFLPALQASRLDPVAALRSQ